jgi:serine/threonine protein phosphatase 1
LQPVDQEPQNPAEVGRSASVETVFAVLPARRVTWAVGSIHGEVGRLQDLHVQLASRIGHHDNLVYLGNFLGFGRDILATVRQLLLFRRGIMAERSFAESDANETDTDAPGAIVYLRGRQEEMWHKLLQVQFAPNPREVLEWMLGHGAAQTLQAYGGTLEEARKAAAMGAAALSQWTNRLRAGMRALDGHDRLMTVLRRAAFTNDASLLLVSAGIDAARPLSEQADAFWWGGRNFESMEGPYSDFRCVVRGFDEQRRGVWFKPWAASIDGGCGFGGSLVAARFDADGRFVDAIEA